MEEVDDLHQGLLGLILSGHVAEGDAGGLLHVDLGVGLAHAADAPDAAALPGHEVHKQHNGPDEQHHGQDVGDHELQDGGHLRYVGPCIVLYSVLPQEVHHVRVRELHGKEGEVLVVGIALLVGVYVALLGGEADLPVGKEYLLHHALLHQILKLAVMDLMGGGRSIGLPAGGGEVVEHHRQHDGPGHQDQQTVDIFLIFVVIWVIVLIVVHLILLLFFGHTHDARRRLLCILSQNRLRHKDCL